MIQHHANRAILVLESPWGLDDSDANRTSVLPFVEGVAKYAGDTEVFHANFYDDKSFGQALDCLCRVRYSNTIVYVAAHGSEGSIGEVDLFSAMARIAMRSRDFNIGGVLLGSCYTGKESTALEACIEESAIRWCVGYASSARWVQGTLIDAAILLRMSLLDEEDHADVQAMIDTLAAALVPFAAGAPIGTRRSGKDVALEDSLQVVIQPSGRGNRARNYSREVFAACAAMQAIE